MEKKKQNRLKLGVYRFWIEYKQFFDGGSTRRMRRRAWERRLRTTNGTSMDLFEVSMFDLA